jgi:tetratricopeptide (TPR) repeat protein
VTKAAFSKKIVTNLAYWRKSAADCEDPALTELLTEKDNICRAIEFGLALPESWHQAIELALDMHYFIEHSGDSQPWLTLLQRGLKLCEEGETETRLRILNHCGQYHRERRDWEASLHAHQEQLCLAQEIGNSLEMANAQLGLGHLYWRQRDYERAERCGQAALEGFQAAGTGDREMGAVITLLGLVAYGLGRYEDAVTDHELASEHFRRTKFTVLLARSLVNLALAEEGAGALEAALASYLEARSLLQNSTYELEKTRLELSVGSLYFNDGRLDEAERAFERAYSPYLRRSGHLYFRGLATNNLGNVYLEQGRFGEAEAMLCQSLRLWKRAGARLQLANTLGSLAKTLAAQGRLQEARKYYDEAIAGTSAFSDDAWAQKLGNKFGEEKRALVAT